MNELYKRVPNFLTIEPVEEALKIYYFVTVERAPRVSFTIVLEFNLTTLISV